jgi:hypothetical protein
MDARTEPKLREGSVDRFLTEWSKSIETAEELERTFSRLVEAMGGMADRGAHLSLVFEDGLTHAWWVAYRELHGEMIPRNPELPPRMMQHEDQIVLSTASPRGDS